VNVRHIHLSGFAHASAGQWTGMLEELTPLCDVLTLTEVAGKIPRRVLDRWALANGWHLHHPTGAGPGQCAILSRRPIRWGHAPLLTGLVLKTARKAAIHAASGRTYGIRWRVWHSPAHNGGLRPGWPTKVYLSALARLRRSKPLPQVVAADWNADLRRREIRDRLRLPGLHWATGADQAPTLHGRLIDGLQTNLRCEGSRTLRHVGGFDHAPVLTILTLKEKP